MGAQEVTLGDGGDHFVGAWTLTAAKKGAVGLEGALWAVGGGCGVSGHSGVR